MTVESAAVAELVVRISRLDSCVVSDALDSLGLPGACQSLSPVWEGARVVGRAVTVRVRPVGSAPSQGPKVHLGVSAIERAASGDVIVVDNEGRTGMGAWGGLLSVAAVEAGVGGVVVYGACRDVDELRELRLPAFAVAATMRTARGRVTEVECGGQVTIDDVAVDAGDLVVADGSGVVFIPASRAEEILEVAERLAAKEAAMARDLRSGRSPSGVLGGDYESMVTKGW